MLFTDFIKSKTSLSNQSIMGLFKNFSASTKSANSSVVDVPTKGSKKSTATKVPKAPKAVFPQYPMLQLVSRY